MNATPAKTYSYDMACESLAEYFLGQPRNQDEVRELAQHVQDAVEAFFYEKSLDAVRPAQVQS